MNATREEAEALLAGFAVASVLLACLVAAIAVSLMFVRHRRWSEFPFLSVLAAAALPWVIGMLIGTFVFRFGRRGRGRVLFFVLACAVLALVVWILVDDFRELRRTDREPR